MGISMADSWRLIKIQRENDLLIEASYILEGDSLRTLPKERDGGKIAVLCSLITFQVTSLIDLDSPLNKIFMLGISRLKTNGRDLGRGNEIRVICFGFCSVLSSQASLWSFSPSVNLSSTSLFWLLRPFPSCGEASQKCKSRLVLVTYF